MTPCHTRQWWWGGRSHSQSSTLIVRGLFHSILRGNVSIITIILSYLENINQNNRKQGSRSNSKNQREWDTFIWIWFDRKPENPQDILNDDFLCHELIRYSFSLFFLSSFHSFILSFSFYLSCYLPLFFFLLSRFLFSFCFLLCNSFFLKRNPLHVVTNMTGLNEKLREQELTQSGQSNYWVGLRSNVVIYKGIKIYYYIINNVINNTNDRKS